MGHISSAILDTHRTVPGKSIAAGTRTPPVGTCCPKTATGNIDDIVNVSGATRLEEMLYYSVNTTGNAVYDTSVFLHLAPSFQSSAGWVRKEGKLERKGLGKKWMPSRRASLEIFGPTEAIRCYRPPSWRPARLQICPCAPTTQLGRYNSTTGKKLDCIWQRAIPQPHRHTEPHPARSPLHMPKRRLYRGNTHTRMVTWHTRRAARRKEFLFSPMSAVSHVAAALP